MALTSLISSGGFGKIPTKCSSMEPQGLASHPHSHRSKKISLHEPAGAFGQRDQETKPLCRPFGRRGGHPKLSLRPLAVVAVSERCQRTPPVHNGARSTAVRGDHPLRSRCQKSVSLVLVGRQNRSYGGGHDPRLRASSPPLPGVTGCSDQRSAASAAPKTTAAALQIGSRTGLLGVKARNLRPPVASEVENRSVVCSEDPL